MINKNGICSAIILIALLSGCVVGPEPGGYVYSDSAPAPIITDVAPPAPQYEEVGIAPAPGYFWISGVWIWEGGRHVWHPGHWSAPRDGYTWVPHQWHRAGNQWRMDGGHWQRRW